MITVLFTDLSEKNRKLRSENRGKRRCPTVNLPLGNGENDKSIEEKFYKDGL